MNRCTAPFLSLAAFAFACKSSSPPPPVVPIPELPVASRTPPASSPSATPPRSAIAALPKPDLAVPSVISGVRTDSTITIGGPSATSSTPPVATTAMGDAGRHDLVFKLVLRDGERSKDSHSRTMTVDLRAGHLVSVTSTGGRRPSASPPVRREGDLSPDDFAKVVSVIEAQRLAESESHVTDTTQHGRYVEATLDVEWRGKKSTIQIAGMTRVAGSEAKTPFAEHPLSKRVAVLLTTLRRIIAGY